MLILPRVMKDALGEYYTLGRYFAKMISNPEVMLATKYGLPRMTLMGFLLEVMANLAELRGGGERPPDRRPGRRWRRDA